jgi:hypothetical protein
MSRIVDFSAPRFPAVASLDGGPDGPTGPTGPTGPAGPPGEPGVAVAPVVSSAAVTFLQTLGMMGTVTQAIRVQKYDNIVIISGYVGDSGGNASLSHLTPVMTLGTDYRPLTSKSGVITALGVASGGTPIIGVLNIDTDGHVTISSSIGGTQLFVMFTGSWSLD